MKRIGKWSAEKRNATVAEFRRMLPSHREDEVKNAVEAGRSLANLMLNAGVVTLDVDGVQMERYRRRFGVVPSLKAVMLAVATGKVKEWGAVRASN